MTYQVVNNETGNVWLVDEGATLNDLDKIEPYFRKSKHGKRETISVYRGCLIVRHTTTHSGRMTVVYLLQPDVGTSLVGWPSSTRAARRMIDEMLKTGVMPEKYPWAKKVSEFQHALTTD